MTALACSSCEQPVCVDCAVQGAVGIKCPDCARTSRAARGIIPLSRLVRGLLAAVCVGTVLGLLLGSIRLPLLGIIMAWLAGMATGEAARRGSGGYRDPLLARGAAACAALGQLLPLALQLLVVGVSFGAAAVGWSLVAAAAAAYGAWSRSS